MFASLRAGLRPFSDPRLKATLFKALGLTLLLFVIALVALEGLLRLLPVLGSPTVNTALEWLAPVALIAAMVGLGAPVTAMFAGLFLDGVAARIEARDYPADPPARGLTLSTGLKAGLALAATIIGVDLALLPFDIFLPGVGEGATWLANGALLGREYFELVALRHVSREQAVAMRQRHRLPITMAGAVIAGASLVPLVNLAAPLFGVGLMVHLFHRIRKTSPLMKETA